MNALDTESFDVVIAGLGPTGLVLAHLLGQRGHRVLVLEREPVFYGNARAVYTDDECMRVFQAVNMADELQQRMLRETPCQWVAPDGSVMAQYCPTERPFGWPVVNFFYQPYLESTLAERLERYPNVEVRRGRELTQFTREGDGVTIVHEATQTYRFTDSSDAKTTANGPPAPRTVHARWLIGADGGRSTVRTLLGIEMTGKSFPEPWLVVDLKAKSPDASGLRHVPYFNFFCNPDGPVVSCPQPDGHHRFEFMLMPGDTKEEMEKPETVRRLLSRYVNMVTCGGQATIPIVAAVSRVAKVHYAEIVAAISSRSAGPGTRANIDEFVETTASALERVGGATRGRAILILNPAEPPQLMRDTVFVLSDDADESAVRASIEAMVAEVQTYVPGYRLKQELQFDHVRVSVPGLGEVSGLKTSAFLEVEGAADYLPAFAGNLDIMTSASRATGERIARFLASQGP